MGKIKYSFGKMSIRKSLLCTFLITVSCICILSGITIFAANKAQQSILSLRGFSISMSDAQKDSTNHSWNLTLSKNAIRWEPLSQTQSVAYYGCYVAMIGLPIFYIISGISLASGLFYRMKLRGPITELQKGIVNIQNDDLDFIIFHGSEDELGELCSSMEKMRSELRKNQKKLWELLEQRKLLNASVAHDLRTPITVLNGYLDYISKYLPQGKLTEQGIMDTVEAMQGATGRLERYVDCVKDIERLEDIKVQYSTEDTESLLGNIRKDIHLLQSEKEILFEHSLASREICIDKQLFLRVLENLLQNAVRYAKKTVSVILSEDETHVVLCVKDDGEGFSSPGIENASSLFFSEEKENGHFGIGLSVCKLICEKLGGSLSLENREEGGALVTAKIKK